MTLQKTFNNWFYNYFNNYFNNYLNDYLNDYLNRESSILSQDNFIIEGWEPLELKSLWKNNISLPIENLNEWHKWIFHIQMGVLLLNNLQM